MAATERIRQLTPTSLATSRRKMATKPAAKPGMEDGEGAHVHRICITLTSKNVKSLEKGACQPRALPAAERNLRDCRPHSLCMRRHAFPNENYIIIDTVGMCRTPLSRSRRVPDAGRPSCMPSAWLSLCSHASPTV